MTTRLTLLLRLALRNVRRQARRSILTAAAMVMGLALLMFSRSLAEGAHEDWIGAGVRLGSGHVAIQNPEFQAYNTLEHRVPAVELARAWEALNDTAVSRHVVSTAPRLAVLGLANSPAAAIPATIIGVDPDLEREFSMLADKLTEGRYLESGDRLHAYVGSRLAERLKLRIGSRLVLTAQDAEGEIAGQLVRVAGIFRTGIPAVDEGLVHIPLSTAQEWLGTEGALTTLAVILESSREVETVVTALRDRLGNLPNVAVLGWRQAMPELDGAVRIDDYGDFLFHGILLAIVALAIVNTVLMSVLNRVREFGVVRALGLTKLETGSIVFLEGLVLTVASGVLGMVIGISFTLLFFRNGLDFSFMFESEFTAAGVVINPVIVPQFTPSLIVKSVAFVVLIGIMSSFYPALRAAKIDIAESMKFEA